MILVRLSHFLYLLMLLKEMKMGLFFGMTQVVNLIPHGLVFRYNYLRVQVFQKVT